MSIKFICRRCERKRVIYPGLSISFSVHSTIWGYSNIKMKNPVCKKCVKEMKDFWESGYKRFRKK